MPFYLVRCWQRVRRKVPCDLDFLWFVAWLFVSMPLPFLLWLLLLFQCRGIAKAHIGPKTVIDFLHTLAHEVPLNKSWELSSDLQSSTFDNPFIPHKWDILKCSDLYVWVCVYMCMYWWCMSLILHQGLYLIIDGSRKLIIFALNDLYYLIKKLWNLWEKKGELDGASTLYESVGYTLSTFSLKAEGI